MRRTPDAKVIRFRLGLTQQTFADRYGFDVESVRNWEQRKRTPSKAAQTLLLLVEKFPEEMKRLVSQLT